MPSVISIDAVVMAFGFAGIEVNARELCDFLTHLDENKWHITRKPEPAPSLYEETLAVQIAPFAQEVREVPDEMPNSPKAQDIPDEVSF